MGPKFLIWGGEDVLFHSEPANKRECGRGIHSNLARNMFGFTKRLGLDEAPKDVKRNMRFSEGHLTCCHDGASMRSIPLDDDPMLEAPVEKEFTLAHVLTRQVPSLLLHGAARQPVALLLAALGLLPALLSPVWPPVWHEESPGNRCMFI